MPRLNFAAPVLHPPVQAARPTPMLEPSAALSNDDVIRLSALGMTTLEVAHDLGNLLQVAGSAVRMIDRSLAAAPRCDLSSIIGAAHASIDRASTLSRRILDSARPRPATSVVYIDTLLNDLHDEIALAVGPTIQIILRIGDYIPAIACNRGDLENVILNLAVNARDAMVQGGLLTLSVSRETPADPARTDPANVLLSVSDNGCGMPKTVAAQAFKPFFTTKPDGRGTGLGLAMVGAFAGRLGGAADLVSAIGKGTTVILRLPSCGG